jgi:acyl carrier protein
VKEQAAQWLCEWFASRRRFKGDASALLNLNYFEAGLLTSLEVIEFVSEIEDRFGVQFSEQDFQDPRFVTVAGVAELIADRSAQSTEKR